MTPMHYFPLSLGLAGLFLAMLVAFTILATIGLMSRVSTALGLNPLTVTLVLFASLIGSYINIPIARLPGEQVVSREVVEIMGVPFGAGCGRLAGNGAGHQCRRRGHPDSALVYLLVRYELWTLGLVAVGIVAFFVHQVAVPVPGLGISVPTFAPPLLAAFVGLVLSRRYAAPLAYIGGSVGVLVGADLLNLGLLRSLGAPIASIGGAGTFVGVFLTGVIAVVLASLVSG